MPSAPAPPLPPARQPGTPYRICLVCLGNYCRSPMAETVLRACLAEAGLGRAVVVDSAGTGHWHVGQPMNREAREALARRGYHGSAHRGRQLKAPWLAERDLFLAMDAGNLADLRRLAERADGDRFRLFAEVGGLSGTNEIPDPYGGDAGEFDYVLGLITTAAPVIVGRLLERLEPTAP
jgi:protein-tyrosine phosphatase